MKKCILIAIYFSLNIINSYSQNIFGLNIPGGKYYELFETDTNCAYNVIKTVEKVNNIITNRDIHFVGNGKFLCMGKEYEREYLYEIDTLLLKTTILHDFTVDSSNGQKVFEKLWLYNGEYYGVTYKGGTSNTGVLFKYNFNSNTYTVVYNFDQQNSPLSDVVVYNGEIYGLKLNYNNTSGSYTPGTHDIYRFNLTSNSIVAKPVYNFTLNVSTLGLQESFISDFSNTGTQFRCHKLADKILFEIYNGGLHSLGAITANFTSGSSFQTINDVSVNQIAINTTNDSSFYFIEPNYYSSAYHPNIVEYKLQNNGSFILTGFSYYLAAQGISLLPLHLTYETDKLHFLDYNGYWDSNLYTLGLNNNSLFKQILVYKNFSGNSQLHYPGLFSSFKIINGNLFSSSSVDGFSIFNLSNAIYVQGLQYNICNFFFNREIAVWDIIPISNSKILCVTNNGIFQYNKFNNSYNILRRFSNEENGISQESFTNSIVSNLNNNVYLSMLYRPFDLNNVVQAESFIYEFNLSNNALMQKTSGIFSGDIYEPINGRLFYKSSGFLFEYNILGNANVIRVNSPIGSYCALDNNTMIYSPTSSSVIVKYDIANNVSTPINPVLNNTSNNNLIQSEQFKLLDTDKLLLISTYGFYGNGSVNIYDLATKEITKVYDYFPADGVSAVNTSMVINNSKVIGEITDGGQYQFGSLYNLSTTTLPQQSLTLCHEMDTTNLQSVHPEKLKCFGCVLGNAVTGINTVVQGNTLMLYPNPTSDQMNISGLDKGQRTLSITNVLGEVVNNVETKGKQGIIIDVRNLSPGVYFATVNNKVYKFIKE
jgi:uncharacterized repeat protein (TIGR03803 family)